MNGRVTGGQHGSQWIGRRGNLISSKSRNALAGETNALKEADPDHDGQQNQRQRLKCFFSPQCDGGTKGSGSDRGANGNSKRPTDLLKRGASKQNDQHEDRQAGQQHHANVQKTGEQFS